MKKKFLALALVGATACSMVALSACTDPATEETYEGGYYYANAWSTGFYGVTAKVTVKNDEITKVEVSNQNDSVLYNISAGWTGHDTADAAYSAYVQSFVGKKVADVKAMTVTKDASGQPETVTGADILCAGQFGDEDPKTGATQTSGRLILAIQNALNEVGKVYIGSYSYENAYSQDDPKTRYGLSVAVTVKDSKIVALTTSKVDDKNLFNVTASWTNASETLAAYNAYVQTFVGKTVEAVKAMTVTTAESGQPETVTGADILCAGQFGDEDPKTGATQTTGRFILALQDALKNA